MAGRKRAAPRKAKAKKPLRRKAKAAKRAPMDGRMAAYLRLLGDPCAAPLTQAPYAGIGSSYLIRTNHMYQPSAGTGTALDFVVEVSPSNYPAMATYGYAVSQGSTTLANYNETGFLTSSVVKGYRPIACCVRWIPTGAIASRAGLIGLAYSPSKTTTSGASGIYPTSFVTSAQRLAPNGATAHEAKWLPSFGDERFGSATEVNINGAGSIMVTGRGVDAVAGIASGYVDITVVWEWEPNTAYGTGSGAYGGITPSTARTWGASLASALGRITDVGKFVFGAMEGIAAYQYGAAPFSRGAAMLLT